LSYFGELEEKMEEKTEILTETQVMDCIGDKLLEYLIGDALSQQIVDQAIESALKDLPSSELEIDSSGDCVGNDTNDFAIDEMVEDSIFVGLAEAFLQSILSIATDEVDGINQFANNFVHQTILDSVQELNV